MKNFVQIAVLLHFTQVIVLKEGANATAIKLGSYGIASVGPLRIIRTASPKNQSALLYGTDFPGPSSITATPASLVSDIYSGSGSLDERDSLPFDKAIAVTLVGDATQTPTFDEYGATTALSPIADLTVSDVTTTSFEIFTVSNDTASTALDISQTTPKFDQTQTMVVGPAAKRQDYSTMTHGSSAIAGTSYERTVFSTQITSHFTETGTAKNIVTTTGHWMDKLVNRTFGPNEAVFSSAEAESNRSQQASTGATRYALEQTSFSAQSDVTSTNGFVRLTSEIRPTQTTKYDTTTEVSKTNTSPRAGTVESVTQSTEPSTKTNLSSSTSKQGGPILLTTNLYTNSYHAGTTKAENEMSTTTFLPPTTPRSKSSPENRKLMPTTFALLFHNKTTSTVPDIVTSTPYEQNTMLFHNKTTSSVPNVITSTPYEQNTTPVDYTTQTSSTRLFHDKTTSNVPSINTSVSEHEWTSAGYTVQTGSTGLLHGKTSSTVPILTKSIQPGKSTAKYPEDSTRDSTEARTTSATAKNACAWVKQLTARRFSRLSTPRFATSATVTFSFGPEHSRKFSSDNQRCEKALAILRACAEPLGKFVGVVGYLGPIRFEPGGATISLRMDYARGPPDKTRALYVTFADSVIPALKAMGLRVDSGTLKVTSQQMDPEILCGKVVCEPSQRCHVVDTGASRWGECTQECASSSYCVNGGICRLKNHLPQCWCPSAASWWFRGEHCEIAESRAVIAIVAGVGSGLGAFAMFAIMVCMARKIARNRQTPGSRKFRSWTLSGRRKANFNVMSRHAMNRLQKPAQHIQRNLFAASQVSLGISSNDNPSVTANDGTVHRKTWSPLSVQQQPETRSVLVNVRGHEKSSNNVQATSFRRINSRERAETSSLHGEVQTCENEMDSPVDTYVNLGFSNSAV